eukprot:TRINITY_DN12596_c0_g3_i1.p1 TRINITY_DN12596_c0_g3~~TRINITY_DN12596_c0_g3_i1.p1  ORF type:complete len:270 (+),score=28.20 TRINITY_DN12596_c0_g3_i1:88-897(+)
MQLQLKDVTIVAVTAGIMHLVRDSLFPDFSDVAVQLTGFVPLVLESHPEGPVTLLVFLVVVCLAMLLHKMVDAMRPEANNQTLKLVVFAVMLVPLALIPFAQAHFLPQGTFRDVLLFAIVSMIIVVYALPRVIEACRPVPPAPPLRRRAKYTLEPQAPDPEQRDDPITFENRLDVPVFFATTHNVVYPFRSETVPGNSTYVANDWAVYISRDPVLVSLMSVMLPGVDEAIVTHRDRTIEWKADGDILWTNGKPEAKVKAGQSLILEYVE